MDSSADMSAENNSTHVVVFALDDRRYGLRLSAVERVVRMVAVTPMPLAPPVLLGVINIRGQIVPVLSLRERVHLPTRTVAPGDQLILAQTSKRRIALAADGVTGVVAIEARKLIEVEEILPGLDFVSGVLKLADGLVMIHDLDAFLSIDEEAKLDEAMSA